MNTLLNLGNSGFACPNSENSFNLKIVRRCNMILTELNINKCILKGYCSLTVLCDTVHSDFIESILVTLKTDAINNVNFTDTKFKLTQKVNKMETKIKNELTEHLFNKIEYFNNDETDFSDLHEKAFNEDYYIIGYYRASEWLKEHNIDAFEAIEEVLKWENDVFGEYELKSEDINSEKIVNLYVYIKGEELISDLFSEIELENTTKSELLKLIKQQTDEQNEYFIYI